MNRFFVSTDAIAGNAAIITGEDAGHISRVLRLKPGDCICLCDGACNEYTARIVALEQHATHLEIVQRGVSDTESAYRVTLYQALPKTGKLETIIQKCVELGIYAIQPVHSARCVVKSDGFDRKLERYARVAYEAAKQSRRGIVPQVLPVQMLANCDFSAHELVLFAYEEMRGCSLKQALREAEGAKDIALIIGPEGGFAAEEAAMMHARGARTVGLGKRILRTETAGMAMLAMVLYELEGV